MSAENLREALIEEIRDLYNAEKQLVKALPKMAKGAESDELRDAFEKHLEETEGQVTRLERVFELLDEKPRGKHCAGMAGIVEEGSEKLQEDMEGSVLDACLIASAQKVEHYEIASYGTLATFAEIMGHQDAKDLLGQTLDEEKEADEKLTQVAGQINFAAEGEGEEEEAGSMTSAGSRSSRGGSSSRSRGRSSSTRSRRR